MTRLRHRRQSDLRELWPEVVDNLTSGVRAGLSLPEALSAIGVRGPEQLREPFRHFGTDYRTTGRFNDSLDRLKSALADPVGDRVCESMRVAREVGGTDLGRLLTTLSSFLRDDARTRSELLARQSWSVNAARMAVCAPWLVLVLLATQKETLAAYDTPTGTVILLIGAALSLLAYRLMIRIGRLPRGQAGTAVNLFLVGGLVGGSAPPGWCWPCWPPRRCAAGPWPTGSRPICPTATASRNCCCALGRTPRARSAG